MYCVCHPLLSHHACLNVIITDCVCVSVYLCATSPFTSYVFITRTSKHDVCLSVWPIKGLCVYHLFYQSRTENAIIKQFDLSCPSRVWACETALLLRVSPFAWPQQEQTRESDVSFHVVTPQIKPVDSTQQEDSCGEKAPQRALRATYR